MNVSLSGRRKEYPAIVLVFLSGLLQGLTLVSFPALGAQLKSALALSDTAYGFIFLPQVALTAAGAIAGGVLSGRLGLPALLSLALAANGLSQGALLLGIDAGGDAGYAMILCGTSLLGLGFGLSAAPLNRYPGIFFPTAQDSALTGLHTLIGAGLAGGPLFVGWLMAAGAWRIIPSALILISGMLLAWSRRVFFPDRETSADAETATASCQSVATSPAFWLLFSIASVYALCEGLFSNWAIIYLREDKAFAPQTAGAALSAFWAALVAGRLLTSWLVLRFPPHRVWLVFPLLIAGALLSLPQVASSSSGIAVYAFAGLACSGFFPLTVGRALARFPHQAAWVSSLMVAALMIGVGIGSFVLGPLRASMHLSTIFERAVALPAVVLGMGVFSLMMGKPRRLPAAAGTEPAPVSRTTPAGSIVCPACGGENTGDAVFCGNPECHKALGEFRYVLEELMTEKNRFERLADRVTLFVSKPHFITLHMIWFSVWVALNSGVIGYFHFFDEYPYDLLSIILSIEAILITGFLLISQNHQTAYSEKRAELDYEITIRSYRKLIELEQRLDRMIEPQTEGD